LGLGDGRPANVAQRIKCHVFEIVALVSNQTLREAGLVSFKDGRVKFINRAGLVKLADFDPAYLGQTSPLAA